MKETLQVLVIDDSPTDRKALAQLLSAKLGCQVATANDGLEGLDKLSTCDFDVIFLDLNMPSMSGAEVLQEIRSYPQTAYLPVVVISGDPGEETVRAVARFNVVDYLLKPYDLNEAGQRLTKSLAEIAAAMTLCSGESGGKPDIQDGRPLLLVADQEANFRNFCAKILTERFHVLEAANGARAIAIALEHELSCMIAGYHIGAFCRDRMVKKIRSVKKLARLKIYALAHDSQQQKLTEPALYDGLIARSMVGDVFLRSFNAVVNVSKQSGKSPRK
jgi:CheY-like chemotaxis protein